MEIVIFAVKLVSPYLLIGDIMYKPCLVRVCPYWYVLICLGVCWYGLMLIRFCKS